MNNQKSVLRKQRAIARVILNNPVFSTPFSTLTRDGIDRSLNEAR